MFGNDVGKSFFRATRFTPSMLRSIGLRGEWRAEPKPRLALWLLITVRLPLEIALPDLGEFGFEFQQLERHLLDRRDRKRENARRVH